jgi:hypothetical protein
LEVYRLRFADPAGRRRSLLDMGPPDEIEQYL